MSNQPDGLDEELQEVRGLGVGHRITRLAAWLIKAKLTHGALIVVVDSEDRLLLVRQRIRERGRWGLPGGFMLVREAPRRAATRELAEETRIEIDEDILDSVAEYRQPWAWHYDHLFTAKFPGTREIERRTSLEIASVGWFELAELPPLTRATTLALTHYSQYRNGA